MGIERRITLGLLFVFLIGVVFYFYYPNVQGVPAADLVYLISAFLAVGGGIWAIRLYGYKNIHAKALVLVVSGIACWVVSEVLWVILDHVLNTEAYPSVADYFFLTGYPLLFLGFIVQFNTLKINWLDRINKLILGLGLLVAFLLFWVVGYFELFLVYDPMVSWLINFVALGTGFGDLLLIIAAFFVVIVTLEYRGGKFSYPWMCFLIGLILYLAGDILYTIYSVEYLAGIGYFVYIDILWISGYLLFAYSFMMTGAYIKESRERLKDK